MLANSILFSEFDRDMIHYALRCAAEHDFDGWFKSSADFERLAQGGYLSCPQCGNTAVNRGMMAPRIVGKAVAPLPTEVHPPRCKAHPPGQILSNLPLLLTPRLGRRGLSPDRYPTPCVLC